MGQNVSRDYQLFDVVQISHCRSWEVQLHLLFFLIPPHFKELPQEETLRFQV